MVLNSALYWVLFANEIDSNDEEGEDKGIKSAILIFIPYILMSINYVLIFLQLEDMQKRARVQGGVAFMNKEKHEKLSKILNIITFTYVAIFIGVQALVMVLTIFNTVKATAFLIELNSLIFFLMILMNA